MEMLLLEQTVDTPYVLLDPANGIFRFSGKSLPEDVDEFYLPLETWIRTYLTTPPKKLTVNFKMDYFNTASLKKIIDILSLLRNNLKSKDMVEIKWHYKSGDDGMREAGEEMQEITEMKFDLVEY
jgi:hypothetical protein